MSLESEITQLKDKLENTALAHSDQWLFIKIHLTLMLIEFIIVAAFCRIFYVRYIRRFLSSLPRTGANSSNEDDRSRLLPDDSQLIAQSGTQIKVGESLLVILSRFVAHSLTCLLVYVFSLEISLPF